MSRGTRRTTAVAVLLLNCCGLAFAQAANNGVASNVSSQSLTSGTWSLVPVATSASTNTQTSFTISPMTKSTAGAKGSYFVIKNFGSVTTLSMTVTQVTSGTGSYTANLHYCSGGTWNTGNGSCSGTITLIVANTNASTNSGTATITLAPNASFQIRAQYVGGTLTISDVISVSVARANVRLASSTVG
mgnify:CR=1 FL=1